MSKETTDLKALEEMDAYEMEANIDAVIAGMGDGEDANSDDVTDDDSGKQDQTESGKPEELTQAKASEAQAAAAEPAPKTTVIKARDGVHELPYSVLEDARREAVTAKQERDALKAQLEQLSQQQAQAKAAESGQQNAAAQPSDKGDEDLAEYEAEFGKEAAEAERKRREHYRQIEQRLATTEKTLQQQQAREAQAEKDARAYQEQDLVATINATIESIPTLDQWRKSDDPLWHAAVAMDQRLQKDPAFANIPMKDRFQAVVDRLTGRTAKNQTIEDPQALLEQKLNKTGTRSPSTLSEIPGGYPSDQTAADEFGRLTAAQFAEKFDRMTPEQQEAYLANL